MFEFQDPSELQEVEEAEMTEPSSRKVYKDHAIYSSRILMLTPALPVLCDFGEARFGSESYGEEAMPDLYRAPEIIMRIEWTEKIDIWALGLVVSNSPHYKKASQGPFFVSSDQDETDIDCLAKP
jgi:serine/threonine protein kinase